MQTSAELVLIIGDTFIPDRAESIPEEFTKLLSSKKFQHILSTGNIGNKETYTWLQTLLATKSKLTNIKSLSDDGSQLNDKEIIKIGDFKIGLISSGLIVPCNDIEMLSSMQKKLDVDILVSGGSCKNDVFILEDKYFINPGSFSGAYSYLGDNKHSFMVMIINGDVGNLYRYELNRTTKAVECSKIELNKNIVN
jgi:vacuolar protein sorting-associated protein 29